MSERKFAKGLSKPGTAAQLRETVSQVVRETAVQSKPQFVEPLDFENFIQKNKTVLQNDPQRELLMYPQDDISQVVVPRKFRTLKHNIPDTQHCNLFTKQCIHTYSSDWNIVHYKYNGYSSGYVDLPHAKPLDALKEDLFEVDLEADAHSEPKKPSDCITKEGYLMKGPEVGSEKMFAHIGSKSFKRRYCYLRQEVDGTYMLEIYKDEKKGEAKVTIVMDFCKDVVKNSRKGRFCFDLLMTAGHKGYVFAAENEADYNDWLTKLSSVIQQHIQEEKRAASLERDRSSPPPPPQITTYGTLKGLEHSMNPQLIRYSRETDLSIAHARKENRRKLLQLYAPIHQNLKSHMGSSSQETIEPYREIFGKRVFIKCDLLRFKLQSAVDEAQFQGQIEPYFTTLCLYDAKYGVKLTENFHFDLNNPHTRSIIPNGINSSSVDIELPEKLHEWILYPKQAVFSVANPHCDIFIVVRIDKVLQGGVNQVSEPYIKPSKDQKSNVKVLKTISSCCQRLVKYRMPFAWAAKPLFRLYSSELDTSSDFPAIYRQESSKMTDEELLKLLSEYRKPDKFSKLTVIPGNLKVIIEPIAELPNNCLNTSLAPIKPFPLPPKNESTLEITEFENKEITIYPYTTFVNHLYVYPQCLIFDTQKMFTRARNLACVVELRDSDAEDAKGLQCIYSRPGHAPLISQASCAVLHHNTTPTWYEEIKIRLPINLQENHHLLFSFYHVSCDLNKKRETIENNVGYAWLPLLQKGRLSIDTQTISVASHLPAGYLSIQPFGLNKGNSGPDITWIDAQRPIFTVSFNLISSVNTRDQHLFNLFTHAQKLLDAKPPASPADKETCKVLKALHAIDVATLIAYLPTLFNQLFVLLVRTSSEEVGTNILRLLIYLVKMIHTDNRREILQTYVKHVFVTPEGKKNQTVHEEMCKYLPSILLPNNTDFLVINYFMHHSNFFFEIVTKSMAQHLLKSGRIKMHRNERFPSEYLKQIEDLSKVLVDYIFEKHKENQQEVAALNTNFAEFLKKCLSLMDRGFVFKLINSYLSKFSPGERSLQEFKYAFLAIICSHEHYIAFNLPISHTSISPKGKSPDFVQEYCLSQEFCKHHFIVSLLLQEVKTSLNEMSHTRKQALNTLRDLIAKHELDDRYQTRGQMSRIALIYVPWLNIVLENINRLIPEDKIEDTTITGNRISSNSSYLFKSSVSDTPSRHRYTLHFSDSPIHIRNSAFFDAIAGQSIMNGNGNGHSSMSLESDLSTMSDNISVISQETTIIREDKTDKARRHRRGVSVTQSAHIPRFDKLPLGEVKEVLLVFLFVVKNLGEDQIISWWAKSLDADVVNFFTTLEIALHTFKYVGKRNMNVMATPTRQHEAKAKAAKAHTLPARMNPAEMNNHDHENAGTLVIHTRDTRENLVLSENEEQRKHQAVLEQALSTETGLIILDLMGLYFQHFRSNLMQSEGNNAIMRKVFDIYMTFLELGQGETLYKHVFASLRSFITNYSVILFQGNAILCGRLCYELLRSCNSRLASVRQESCAVLYLLMRSNFEFTGRKGLIRVHLQVIISVSQILGNVIGLNNSRFQESLSIVNSYASSDKVMKGTGFPLEVKDLTKRIRTVLMATVQMKEHHHDPEMLVDLQHSLANSYASTPELRHTWLENMIRNHVRDGNFSEAACCQLHIVALMAEYLKLKKIQDWGSEVFDKISSNISRDERGLKLDIGVQDVQYSEYTLLQKLEACIEFIDKSERYELLGELYKLIIPIYEKKRSYQLLQECYSNLAMYYGKIVEANRTHKRLLGRFYRVGLYGQAFFEDDSGSEYVYKEPKVTALSEISERLYKQYCLKFGAESVKMIQDSIPIDQSQLDQKYAFIQVTHVTPYFEKCELDGRQTEFEQNHDINCFMFETPFTKEGKARGSPEEQWKRRTMLTTEYSFPYVTKRVKVIKKRSMELSPIEVAIDEMQNRVNELEDVVFSLHTDAKKLQLLLQGSVYVQVNAGPLAYASVFLDPALCNLYPDDKVEELKDIYREFIKICYSALQLNSKIISHDQREYQEVLRNNYIKLCAELSALFGESLWPHEETGSFKRNSMFSPISGVSHNSSTA